MPQYHVRVSVLKTQHNLRFSQVLWQQLSCRDYLYDYTTCTAATFRCVEYSLPFPHGSQAEEADDGVWCDNSLYPLHLLCHPLPKAGFCAGPGKLMSLLHFLDNWACYMY